MIANTQGPLTRAQILAELKAERVFKPGTWREANIRPVGYDVRMAKDVMVVPADGSETQTKHYKPGEMRDLPVVLQPGQSAFISSAEQFCLPRDVVGQIGQKFALVSQGVMTLTGLLIDPGYGLNETGAAGQARLHFLLANVGSRPVVLQPGETRIATILFTRLEEEVPAEDVHSVGFKQIDDQMAESGGAGIAIFRHVAALDDKLREVRSEMELSKQRLLGIESGSNQIVMFGLYLVCVTILGASLATMLAIAANTEATRAIARAGEQLAPHWLVLVLVGLASVTLARLIVWAVKKVGKALRRPSPRV